MIKFNDVMHEGTDDGFKIEVDYKKRLFVRIYQEMDSGIVREVYLSHEDMKQINTKIIDATREEI